MDNVIDFLEFKKNKEKEQEEEIELLRKELAAIIDDMGGIHTVPFLITDLGSSYETASSWTPLPLYSYAYYDFDNDGKKD